ncbi:MAG: alpha-galactosidase [Clostridia bacterium]|nr:alpha-galactosidase [Clostridia bacterium]
MKNLLQLPIRNDEYWWCGVIDLSYKMPFTKATNLRFDMLKDPYTELCTNQLNPLFLSSDGRYAYLPEFGVFTFENGTLTLESDGEILHGEKANLREACLHVNADISPPTGQTPPSICFTAPQYCTWMELLYGQNQEEILAYARRIVAEGLPAGEFIIDDGWQEYYGHWDFDPRKFPDPKKMCDELISLGFKVVLWIAPYISPDSDVYRALLSKGCLLKNPDGKPFITEWWDGYSAVLDLSHPDGEAWFAKQYEFLHKEYGICGLKMDGGDVLYYPKFRSGYKNLTAHEHCELYGKFDCGMEIKELRACVKNGNRPIIQRVADRKHSWDRQRGLGGIVERILLQGMTGYPFNCPDMVGGGLIEDDLIGTEYSEELYCRYAQASTFLPSFQLSKFFWKRSAVLSEAVHTMVKRHYALKPYLEELLKTAATTGEPIARSIAYQCNERPDITDEFILGDKYLIAPVLTQGATSRNVYLPTGEWKYIPTGEIFKGGKEYVFQADVATLPYFEKIS